VVSQKVTINITQDRPFDQLNLGFLSHLKLAFQNFTQIGGGTVYPVDKKMIKDQNHPSADLFPTHTFLHSFTCPQININMDKSMKTHHLIMKTLGFPLGFSISF
jgi:hypothetical protein